jgi:hypothetical protein
MVEMNDYLTLPWKTNDYNLFNYCVLNCVDFVVSNGTMILTDELQNVGKEATIA